MKNYRDSDHAVNKHASGIVYRFRRQTVEATLEIYLLENPGKTEADFARFKTFSDEDYSNQDKADCQQTHKNVSIHSLDETDACCVPSPEEILFDEPERVARKESMRRQAYQALSKLTEVQRRRYLMYHVHGLSEEEIAEIECTTQQAVSKSLLLADKRISAFFD